MNTTNAGIALLLLALGCGGEAEDPMDAGLAASTAEPLEAILAVAQGLSLDGRSGLELHSPNSREAAFAAVEQKARYWANTPEAIAELERLLQTHEASADPDQSAMFAALESFVDAHAVFTESYVNPELHDLTVDGDRASAYRVGHNPGGEFREDIHLKLLDGRWYLTPPPN